MSSLAQLASLAASAVALSVMWLLAPPPPPPPPPRPFAEASIGDVYRIPYRYTRLGYRGEWVMVFTSVNINYTVHQIGNEIAQRIIAASRDGRHSANWVAEGTGAQPCTQPCTLLRTLEPGSLTIVVND